MAARLQTQSKRPVKPGEVAAITKEIQRLEAKEKALAAREKAVAARERAVGVSSPTKVRYQCLYGWLWPCWTVTDHVPHGRV